MRIVLALAVLIASATAAHARTPLPTRGDHSVYDAANVIDDAREQQLEAINTELFQRAGVAIVVVTVPKLVDETISDLAVRVQKDWGVGVRGKDESVVLALSVEDRKIFLATGYGSEGYLPDGKVGEIRDRAMPALRANDFAAGLVAADTAVAQVAAAAHDVTLTGVPAVAAASGEAEPSNLLTLIVLAVFALIVIGGMFRGRGGRGGGFGSFAAGALLGSMFGHHGRGASSGGRGGGFGGFGGGSGGGGGAGGDF